MKSSCWKVWADSKTEPKASKVFQRFKAMLRREPQNVRMEPYPKTGGHVFSFSILLQSRAWNDAVVEVIELGQRVGYAWILSGDVLRDLYGCSKEAHVGGVVFIQWMLCKGEANDESRDTGRNGAGRDDPSAASPGERP